MPPTLKTDFSAETGDPDYTQYPQDFDSNFLAILDSFNAIESDIAQFFAGQQVLFGLDLSRRLDIVDPIGGVLGGSYILDYSQLGAGTFKLVNQNAENMGVINIGGSRRQRQGDLTGTLQALIDSGEVIDQGGGQWDGVVFIGVSTLSTTDIQVAFSTNFVSVGIAVWEADVTVTGLPGAPVWTFNFVRRMDRTRYLDNVLVQTELERPRQFGAQFAGGGEEHVVVVPFIHRMKFGFFMSEEQSVGYTGTFTVDQISPSVPDIVTPIAVSDAQGVGTVVREPPIAAHLEVVKPADTAYLLQTDGGTFPTRWLAGVEVVPEQAVPITP